MGGQISHQYTEGGVFEQGNSSRLEMVNNIKQLILSTPERAAPTGEQYRLSKFTKWLYDQVSTKRENESHIQSFVEYLAISVITKSNCKKQYRVYHLFFLSSRFMYGTYRVQLRHSGGDQRTWGGGWYKKWDEVVGKED